MHNIARIEQVFPQELADRLHKTITETGWHYGWRSNFGMGYGHWNKSYVKSSSANGLDIADKLENPAIIDAWNLIKELYVPDHILLRCYANAHTYGIEGYPHTDSSRPKDKTILMYINKNWRREYGGETVIFKDNEILLSELPRHNRGLIFPGNYTHTARGATRICPDLRMTLMFKVAPSGLDLLRDEIQKFTQALGADKIKHYNDNLGDHLLRTYDLLKNKNAESYTTAAGGLHSIMGTNHFKQQVLDPKYMRRITIKFGPETTRLVELFSKIKKTETLESALKNKSTTLTLLDGTTIVESQHTINQLCLIEAANLADQNCLKQHTNLQEFWNGQTTTKNT